MGLVYHWFFFFPLFSPVLVVAWRVVVLCTFFFLFRGLLTGSISSTFHFP